jgi:flagellar hook-associated protein FlgK
MGLYVQREALLSAQKSLDITGNNLANLETKGYTRQRVDMSAVASMKNTLGYNSAVGGAGRGAEIMGIAQVRDALLDTKFRTYTGDYSDTNAKTSILSQLEDALDNLESESTGFMSIVASMKSTLQSYSSDNADRKELGTILMNNARSVTDMLRQLDSRIGDVSKQALSETQYAAKDVNSILAQLAALNKSIKDSYINMGYTKLAGGNYSVQTDYGPLELKDSFNLLVDQLSEYGDVDMKQIEDGSYVVSFAGHVVVNQDQYSQIAYRDDSYGIPTVKQTKDPVTGDVTYTPLTDAQMDELKNPDPGDLQFVVLNEGVLDPKTGKYTGLKNNSEWYELSQVLQLQQKTVDDFLRGDGEIVFDKQSSNQLIRRVSEKFEDLTRSDITDPAVGLTTGSLRGFLDLYNGAGDWGDAVDTNNGKLTNSYEGIPYFRNLINNFAKTFADTMNGIYNKENHTYPGFPVDDDQVLFSYDYHYLTEDASGQQDFAKFYIDTASGETISDRFGYSTKKDLATASYLQVTDANGNAVDLSAISEIMDAVKAEVTASGSLSQTALQTILDNYAAGDPKLAMSVRDTSALGTIMDADSVRGTASSLVVTDFWQENPTVVTNPDGYDEDKGLDNSWINKMLGAFTVKHQFKGETSVYSFEDYISHYGNELGNRIQYETKIAGTGEVMLLSITDARDEVQGTSIDEEGINMMNYQKWYNAIARMTTTMDEALDRLINSTGRVGL